MAYVRTVRTSSGAVAVQVVWKSRHGSRDIEHLGSAHTDAEVEVLKAVAAQRIADGQDELPFGVPAKQGAGVVGDPPRRGWVGCWTRSPRCIASSRLDKACGGDVVFEQLVTARIIEPTSKQDAAGFWPRRGAGAVVSDGEAATAQAVPGRTGGTGCPGRARPPLRWDRRRWCCMT